MFIFCTDRSRLIFLSPSRSLSRTLAQFGPVWSSSSFKSSSMSSCSPASSERYFMCTPAVLNGKSPNFTTFSMFLVLLRSRWMWFSSITWSRPGHISLHRCCCCCGISFSIEQIISFFLQNTARLNCACFLHDTRWVMDALALHMPYELKNIIINWYNKTSQRYWIIWIEETQG